jgi:hypothetical protein
MLVGAAGGSSSADAPEGTASGTLVLNGVSSRLSYAYATAKPGFFDKAGEDIHILLSDVPLSEAVRADVFDLIGLAREGKARAVEVVLGSSGQPISGAIFAPAFQGMASAAGIHEFEPTLVDRTHVAGRLWMDGPRTFGGVTFQYDVTFAATIPRPPSAAEVAAALASPPAQTAAAHLAAIRSGLLPAFLDTLGSALTARYAGRDGPAEFDALRSDTPPDSRVVALVQENPTRALATVQGSRDAIVIEYTLELVVEAGLWKVAR